MPLLSYVLAHNEPTLTNTAWAHAFGCHFLHTVHTKQRGYECYHIPTHQVTVIPTTPTIIVTIDTVGKSDIIQNLKITNLCGHILFDATDPAFLVGVDDDNDEDTPLAGVQGNDSSLAGVPIPIATNDNDKTWTQNPITTSLTPMRPMTNQTKHLYTALEAMYHFTIQLMDHHNILQMRKSQMTSNCLSWKPKYLYYVNPKEFLYQHLSTPAPCEISGVRTS